jgi:mRNA-degrading endonuclease YafQ of YafQ-DinJ toxin-antitoxin module
MKSVFMLVYTSQAAVEITQEVLADILKTADARNKREGISGFLIARAGYFLQLIEGDEAKVRALYRDISLDTRHRSVILQGEAFTDSRIAPDWSMQLVEDRKVAESEAILSLLDLGRHGKIYSERASLESIVRIFAKDAKPIKA